MTPRGRGRALRVVLLVVVTLTLGGRVPSAVAAGARVRWTASEDPRVVGYHLYVRPAGRAYGAPIDVGPGERAADGTLSSVVEGLADGETYHLAVAAYTADGAESALSGELALGALDPCATDRCVGPSECDFGALPDGTWCARDVDGDPCAAVGRCVAGTCAASVGARLGTARVRIGVWQRTGWLRAYGRFRAPADFDPRTTGATLELADAAGAIVYRATLPGDALTQTRETTGLRSVGTRYRYVATRREAQQRDGLRAVRFLVSGDSVGVMVRAEALELRAVTAEPELRVALRLGDTCASALALACEPFLDGGIACR